MASRIREIPKGFHTVTPYLTVTDSARAIDFYKRAFGAEELLRLDGPDGKVAHADLKIGDSIIMLASTPSVVRAANKVSVRQWPAGTPSATRSPRGARP